MLVRNLHRQSLSLTRSSILGSLSICGAPVSWANKSALEGV